MKIVCKTLIISILLIFASCSPDDPEVITNKDKEKDGDEVVEDEDDRGHGDWNVAVYRFTEGEINDSSKEDIHFKGYTKNNTSFNTVQEYKFKKTNDGVVIPNKKPIRLIAGKAYSLEVFYYGEKGKLINHEFATKEMSPLHQHFFIPTNITSIKKGVKKAEKGEILDYIYRDTNHVEKMLGEPNVVLREKIDPLGFKGYFTVNKSYQAFNLRVILVHVVSGKKLADDGTPYPFYAPSSRVASTTDLSLKIPVKIFTSIKSDDYKKEIAKEFTISEEKAQLELKNRNLGKLKI